VDAVESVDVPLPGSATDGHATILEYRPESVRVDVETSGPAVLVLADAFEPGWTARTETGETLEIFRTNGLLRAVLVPQGRSQVHFHYETPGLRFGAWLSALGLLIVVLLVAFGHKTLTVSNRSFLYQN
jgi:uncharacterized membrane protein YfhO